MDVDSEINYRNPHGTPLLNAMYRKLGVFATVSADRVMLYLDIFTVPIAVFLHFVIFHARFKTH